MKIRRGASRQAFPRGAWEREMFIRSFINILVVQLERNLFQ